MLAPASRTALALDNTWRIRSSAVDIVWMVWIVRRSGAESVANHGGDYNYTGNIFWLYVVSLIFIITTLSLSLFSVAMKIYGVWFLRVQLDRNRRL